jgi:RNA recognition motif-containing protein
MLGVVKALQSDKIDHKLFVGNIPNDISQSSLVDVLNKALKKLGIEGDSRLPPIATAWISPDS